MATLDFLKRALRQRATTTSSSPIQPLSNSQYDAGFSILANGGEWITYRDFIIPQLSLLLRPLCNSRTHISALEIGPGPESVLRHLSDTLRRKIETYTAYEPNELFATRLENSLLATPKTASPLPCLVSPPNIHRIPFVPGSDTRISNSNDTSNVVEKFDIVIFCHSMYGMKPKHKFIERALEMLLERPEGSLVVVFHREGNLHLSGLTCYRTASFPNGVIRVADNDGILDEFAPFIAGFPTGGSNTDKATKIEWRKVCRDIGRREKTYPDHLSFSSPNMMIAFTRHAMSLPELTAQVPTVTRDIKIKNWEARLHCPGAIVRPTEVQQVQQCVRWALKHRVALAIIGGGHSGHCVQPSVVSIDMGAFDGVHILTGGEEIGGRSPNFEALVVAEAGCKTGDIARKTSAANLTVPLGSRPSVGAGSWLQGGIGHLARLHGLACDAILGAVVVSVASGDVLCIGHVPTQYRPVGTMQSENDVDLLWAIKGAGTNIGIVLSVTFKAHTAPIYSIRHWFIPLGDKDEARLKLTSLDESIAMNLPRDCSVDGYLYWDKDELHLGVTLFEASTARHAFGTPASSAATSVGTIFGLANDFRTVDGVGLFETELYISGMHGGHNAGKTSSFKRCLFLRHIGTINVTDIMVAAIATRPSPLCYLHLLQGGGAVGDVPAQATAFGCREWSFACIITGVWRREQDGSEVARAAVQWVYDVVSKLLPLSDGSYGADLGPDPRDAVLALKAFGPNLSRLTRLKRTWDPCGVLAYACPLPKTCKAPKLVVLVTGESCAGKDYCAEVWVSVLAECSHQSLRARAVSISDAMKREYAATTGADLKRLLYDRAYKEQHRPKLSAYFQDQQRQRPRLAEQYFVDVLDSDVALDVLFITGMRDDAPVATFGHLIPGSRLLEVCVKASHETRDTRRGCPGGETEVDDGYAEYSKENNSRPDLIFNNDRPGSEEAERFCEECLLPFFQADLQRLADMVHVIPDFPHHGIEFRNVLGISEQPGGLALCTSLLQSQFIHDWTKIDVLACCEVGGLIYASALASRVGIPLALIREAGKLPPPTISVSKSPSHISSQGFADPRDKEMEMEMSRDAIHKGASVVVVDDVLATGKTLCAVLELLDKAGIGANDVTILVVAEFPVHRGRELLRRCGFGGAKIQSLLIFDGE